MIARENGQVVRLIMNVMLCYLSRIIVAQKPQLERTGALTERMVGCVVLGSVMIASGVVVDGGRGKGM